jgi:2-polyprenyl-6-methoxyphenol hydroxylase-like FAD-dependent oxidoreductase
VNESILVVGAGPVGMTMAMSLQRQGVAVRIIDKNAARTDKSKALVMWPRTLELLDIQGCAQPFIDAGVKGLGARIIADGRDLVHVSLTVARSIYKYALLIAQSETERLLEAQLADLGVRVERMVELQTFAEDGNGVNASLRHDNGRVESVSTPYLIGCDGAHSTVRNGVAAPFAGATLPSDWLLGDMLIDGPLAQDELTMCWTQAGILALFPMGGARFRMIADTGLATTEVNPPPTLAELQVILDRRGPAGLRGRDPYWLSRFRINERKVKDYRYGRVFIAGDAAHIHSPAGGQGMNTGMQDAFNLAWKLAMVCKGNANATLLDSYSVERSAIGDQVLRNAGRMTEVAMLRNPLLQELRNLVASTVVGHVPAVRQRMVDALTEVDLHYPNSPLTQTPRGSSGHPGAGNRARDIALTEPNGGPTSLHAALGTGKFVLLAVGVSRVELPQALTPIAISVSAEADVGYDTGHVYLIRPDAYVALSTDGLDNEAMLSLLGQISAAS